MTRSASPPEVGGEGETEAGALVAAFRHDTHKLRGRKHASADEAVCGVRVNEAVPLGADRDAALLSRPDGEPEETVATHVSPRRLSLLTGAPVDASDAVPVATDEVRGLVESADAPELHAAWLTSDVAARVNESLYYPYTSLKYHTLLVAALLDNYRAGYAFDELFVVVSSPDDVTLAETEDPAAAVAAESVTPCRTVLWTPAITVRVTGERPPGEDCGVARLGATPTRSFADVWSRVSACPFDRSQRWWRVVDAQLRRIRSFSTALQFIEDATRAWGRDAAGLGVGR